MIEFFWAKDRSPGPTTKGSWYEEVGAYGRSKDGLSIAKGGVPTLVGEGGKPDLIARGVVPGLVA